MKADFSRNTYDPHRHYRRVLGQQGRVVIDTDRNEQTAIDLATSEQTSYDVIGPSGVPETSLTEGNDGGFQIGIASGGGDLTISLGRIYVDGVLVENDHDTTLLTQPFLPLAAGALGPAGISGKGVYGAYLDVWERVVTPVDDPNILEVALGGPDTSLRSQIAWQIKFGAIDTSEFGENPVCAQILPPWGYIPPSGKLAAQGGAPSTDPLPCVLPPQTGYQSLENQLYRVEIHTAGKYGTATFKWSRENGSVIAGIVSQQSGSVASPTYNVQTVGRDATLGFATGDWVELIDDDAEFQRGVGELLQCGVVDSGAMTIALQSAPTIAIDPKKHPKFRRWDQQQNASATGVPIPDGSWITLENGVEVSFSSDTFQVGDYWLIPARTATSADTVGTVEWPTDPSTGNALFRPPLGVKHHYTKLAIVAFDGEKFSPPQGTSAVTDCRLFFPPLTSVQQQATPCTIVLQPSANWTAQIAALFSGQATLDAEICFTTGTFSTSQPVVIATTGNVKVSGAGWGTKLVGTGIEAVLQFQGCASAVVRDLSASAASVDAPPDATTKASRVIHGALDFSGCGEVLVENVSLACGSALLPGAACLVVRSDPSVNPTTGTGVARIRGSTLAVGEMQYGILLVHQQRAYVENNTIDVPQAAALTWTYKVAQPRFQAQLARALLTYGTVATPAATSSSSSASSSSSIGATHFVEEAAIAPIATRTPAVALNAGVTVGKTSVSFKAPAQLGNVLQTYVDLNGPKEFASASDLYAYVQKAALTLVTNPNAAANFPTLQGYLNSLRRLQVTVAARGIAVGGQAITELRINNNSISHVIAGIVAGVSHREKRPPALPANSMQSVTIGGNVVNVALPTVGAGSYSRFGIFVGNAADVLIENNRVALTQTLNEGLASDGIRVYGYHGKKLIVRHNHTSGFSKDVHVRSLLPTGPKHDAVYWYTLSPKIGTTNANLWLVADNVVEANDIDAPACIVTDNWP